MTPAPASKKTVLFVAYHFPPLAGSSGIQRTLRFVQHLPKFGWEAAVLTAHPRAYERTSDDLMKEVPPATPVVRAQAFDTARHLAFQGRYLGALARPDRWVSWRPFAVRAGLQMVRQLKPAAIISTYPIATAHLIASRLHQKTGLPWLADFRDPMAQEGYPADPLTHQQFQDIEHDAMKHARFSIFTTPGAAAEYKRRYAFASERMVTVENGYDEEAFSDCTALNSPPKTEDHRVVLLHSGIVYPSERDPTQLFQALQMLAGAGHIQQGKFVVRFRAAVAEDLLRRLAASFSVESFVEIVPAIPYRQALVEMTTATGLLVMQASNCNEQIPAKIYEYMRSGRPIVCLADPLGDTAKTLENAGVNSIAPLDDAKQIAELINDFLGTTQSARNWTAREAAVQQASRLHRTEQLAELLEQATC